MTKTHTGLVVLIAFLAGLLGAWVFTAKKTDHEGVVIAASVKESAYDRVMRTQTIRCGYALWAPMLMKDPNTGKLSGVFYDYVEALGKALSLKIDWAEETGLGDFPAALNFGRIDAMCSGGWANSARARIIDYTSPILYQPVFVYARIDDHRFDNNLAAINNRSILIAAIDGGTPRVIAEHDFPEATFYSLPQLSDMSEPFVAMSMKKADLVLMEPSTAAAFAQHNPDKIRRVPLPAPLRVFGTGLAIGGGQDRLQHMLDMATRELISSGEITRIMDSYKPLTDDFFPVAPPYKETTP